MADLRKMEAAYQHAISKKDSCKTLIERRGLLFGPFFSSPAGHGFRMIT